MTPVDRSSLETQLDRHLRRGELPEAQDCLRRLCAEFPFDGALSSRLSQLEQSLEPEERNRTAQLPASNEAPRSPMHQAEALAATGKYKDAISIYRSLLSQRPDSDLLQERLAELFQLAQVAGPQRRPVNRAQLLELLLERISKRKRT